MIRKDFLLIKKETGVDRSLCCLLLGMLDKFKLHQIYRNTR